MLVPNQSKKTNQEHLSYFEHVASVGNGGSSSITFDDSKILNGVSISYAELIGVESRKNFLETNPNDQTITNKYLLSHKSRLSSLNSKTGGLNFAFNLNAWNV